MRCRHEGSEMKLYIFQVAPNPTEVRLYLAEKAASGAVIDLPQVSINLPKGDIGNQNIWHAILWADSQCWS
jgi:hypothetical protein